MRHLQTDPKSELHMDFPHQPILIAPSHPLQHQSLTHPTVVHISLTETEVCKILKLLPGKQELLLLWQTNFKHKGPNSAFSYTAINL